MTALDGELTDAVVTKENVVIDEGTSHSSSAGLSTPSVSVTQLCTELIDLQQGGHTADHCAAACLELCRRCRKGGVFGEQGCLEILVVENRDADSIAEIVDAGDGVRSALVWVLVQHVGHRMGCMAAMSLIGAIGHQRPEWWDGMAVSLGQGLGRVGEAHIDDVGVCVCFSFAIRRLSFNCQAAPKADLCRGVLSVLCALLERHPDNIQLWDHIGVAIGNLALESEPNQTAILQFHPTLPQQIVLALQRLSASSRACDGIAHAIVCFIARSKDFQEVFLKFPELQGLIVGVMQTHLNDVLTIESAVKVVSELTGQNADHKQRFATTKDLHKALLSAVRTHPHHADICRYAAKAMWSLAQGDLTSGKAFTSFGDFTDVLHDVLRGHDSTSVCVQVMYALFILADQDRSWRAKVARSGRFKELIQEMMARYPENDEIEKYGQWVTITLSSL